MTLDTMFHFALAFAQGSMAVMLWHRAMPRIREARGQWQTMCVWLLGITLALLSQATLTRAWAGLAVHWYFAVPDVLILLYAGCRLRHALTLSDETWTGVKR